MKYEKDIYNYLCSVRDGDIKIIIGNVEEKYKSNMFPKGNDKLPNTIWSFSYNKALECTSQEKGFCKMFKSCYARHSEARFKNNKCYDINKRFFYEESVQTICSYLVQKSINSKIAPLKVLRINVNGDIRFKGDLKKFDLIARYLNEVLGTKTYLYTKRYDFIPSFKKLKYINVNISEKDIKGFNMFKAYRNETQRQEALKSGEINTLCNCINCVDCQNCISGKNLKIGCLYH